MSNETDAKRLTVSDPLDQETLARFGDLESTRLRLGAQLLDLEDERVNIVVSARRIEDEKKRLFEKVLMDRGLPPTTPVEIEATTGLIKVLRAPAPSTAPQPAHSQPIQEQPQAQA